MENRIATIIRKSGELCRYFDKNGEELSEGDYIKDSDGKIRKLYRTENDELGVDATNPIRIEMGLACECEAGIYPLEFEEMSVIEKYEGGKE